MGALNVNFSIRIHCVALPKFRGTSHQEPRTHSLCGFAPLLWRCEAKLSKAEFSLLVAVPTDTRTERRQRQLRAGKSVPIRSFLLRCVVPLGRHPGFLCHAGLQSLGKVSPCVPGSGCGAWVSSATSRTFRSPQASADQVESPAVDPPSAPSALPPDLYSLGGG